MKIPQPRFKRFVGIFAKKPKKTKEQVLTVKYRVFLALFIISFSGLIATVYFNFDYFAFKILMTTSYSYTETLDELYRETLRLGEDEDIGRYGARFDNVVIGVVTEKIQFMNNDRYTYLYTPEEYVIQGETTKRVADEARIEKIDDDTVYVRIPNISSFTKDFLYENKEEINKYKYLLLDLRSNYGGNLDHCYSMADLFIEKGAVIGYELTRLFNEREIKASANKYFDFERIYILQNRNSASAAESLTLALKENLDNVVITGERSFGKGIGQVTINLKRGYAVKATTLRLLSPSGNSVHTVGIPPDLECSSEDAFSAALADIAAEPLA